MKIYITGRGTGGSWKIRGEQLGQAIGAQFDRLDAEVGILVKRPDDASMYRLRGLPIIWDVVDAWPQPSGNDWHQDQAMEWLRGQVHRINPVGIVAATEQMSVDCAEFGLPVVCIPHHARLRQELNPVRSRVHTVGYEGGEKYLGWWRAVLEKECAIRGWRFRANPDSLSDLDIVVALREARGYPVRKWKSNVKLANAQITGTPCILSPESGYLETQAGVEEWAEDEKGLTHAMDRLEDYQNRAVTSRILQTAAPHLAQVASRYQIWLDSLSKS
jgi:hypothetical protein